MLLHVYCARYDAPPTPPVYAIHYTILVMTISYTGQPMAQTGSYAITTSFIISAVIPYRVQSRKRVRGVKGYTYT